ncbi:hypothetical protein J4G48_0049850 (plasmid) [Bradyrhizobium barranii subsp. apii]|uniref:hypothetical protein n=1 Tax=Bradyrhizobium TaxID=374 RepID=UPI001CD30170|nr:hypothetical protein [Bradyrhizobium barranii]UPU01657.1 hypothetical protein J4G48_0049850 [Bradyrhizobium barranii subsp. apii]
MNIMTEWTQGDVLARYTALTTVAHLTRLQVKPSDPAELIRLFEALDAKSRAVDYTAECIAHELYKVEPPIFTPELQARFEAVGEIVDRHVHPGPTKIDQRRTLIERVEAYAPASPRDESYADPNDNTAIANSLNVRLSGSEITSYLRNREIGLREKPPEATLQVDRPFDGDEARRLANTLGALYQEVDRRLAIAANIFSESEHTRVNDFLPNQIDRELERAFQTLDSKPPDPTLARIDQRMQATAERIREMSDDSFSSPPENAPATSVTTTPRQISSRRRKHEEISSSDGAPQMGPAGHDRRPSERAQSSRAGTVSMPRGEAADAREEDVVFDRQVANLRERDRPRRQGPDQDIASVAPNDPRSEPINQRSLRERQRNRGRGLDY